MHQAAVIELGIGGNVDRDKEDQQQVHDELDRRPHDAEQAPCHTCEAARYLARHTRSRAGSPPPPGPWADAESRAG